MGRQHPILLDGAISGECGRRLSEQGKSCLRYQMTKGSLGGPFVISVYFGKKSKLLRDAQHAILVR